jgi:hypothetical protein
MAGENIRLQNWQLQGKESNGAWILLNYSNNFQTGQFFTSFKSD